MNVRWTRKADQSFNGIVDYLLDIWIVEIATNFVDMVDHTITLIRKNPEMFKVSQYDTISREAFITKHTTMFYRILDDIIEIEYFWGNFDDPEKMSELLKFN
ncbi:type II toxin-antitoxin system RelE/ParE family toxin [Aggregatimonas sangjinii]|uniref:Type II toxin-antitoxin system RelE/ParE family toxin n=1 Tax=Aggregatimonas sangjinii TaxID=2583587 RepID=A0A5B7SVK8_9FLAO|nr:type II toxin-antitoxin system RelE/ParE family toxin [Aggregatimonas sangjinii]QCX01339.1 type II toxin-antitoxin system RelE/ParE family toxin [Aggregatimonas sangjinii]